MARSYSEHQLSLPPTEVPKGERASSVLPKREQGAFSSENADILAAELVDEALTMARISNAEAAYLLGVSESLVRKMRSRNTRERMSHGQMLRLGAVFNIQYFKALNGRTEWFTRAAIATQFEGVAFSAVASR